MAENIEALLAEADALEREQGFDIPPIVHDLAAALRESEEARELLTGDLYRIAEALSIGARPYSGHEAMDKDILPAIAALQEEHAEAERLLARTERAEERLGSIERVLAHLAQPQPEEATDVRN